MTVLITVGDYLLNVNLNEYIHSVMEKINVFDIYNHDR